MENIAVHRRKGEVPRSLQPLKIKNADWDIAKDIQRKLKKNGIEMDAGEIEKKLGDGPLSIRGFTAEDVMKSPQLLLWEEKDLEKVQPQLDMNQDAGGICEDI
ncbi:MAG: hypothetical protein AB1468_03670 [Candidatus Micrarchaeota archaeon]